MPDVGEEVTKQFVAAYRPYIRNRLSELGIAAPDGLGAALDTGAEWLEKALQALLSLPYAEQTQSPLEIFRVMMLYPTEVLAEAGVEPRQRDEAVVAVLPGDIYDLAPASSQDLGEAAWEAHLAWGAAKASGFAQSTVLAFGNNMIDGSRVLAAVKDAGLPLAPAATAVIVSGLLRESTMRLIVAFVDLEHEEANDVLRLLQEHRVKTYAYGPHVDDMAMAAARALGADAVPRSRFFKMLPELIPSRA